MKKMYRRISAALLSTVVVVSSATGVYAGETKVTGGTDEYTFEKLSHSDKGSGEIDGLVDYLGNGQVGITEEGQGDRGQNYSWAALPYEDEAGNEYVYVGTCYNSMGNTLVLMDSALGDHFDSTEMEATLNALYNGDFYTGQEDGVDSNGVLVKVNITTGETKIIMANSVNGTSPMFRNGISYNGKLYFCGTVGVVSETNPTGVGMPGIWEIDPTDDSFKCVHNGLNNLMEYGMLFMQKVCTGIRGLTEYKYNNNGVEDNALIISCVGVNGPYISISDDPASGEFTEIADMNDLFNYPAYHYYDSIYGGSIWEMQMYNGSLYVAICTGTPDNKPDDYTMQSFAIVRGDCDGDPLVKENWTWTAVVGDKENDGAKYTFGIDPERTRAGACNMVIYNDYLYIGEYNDTEIALEDIIFKKDFQFMAKNLEQSVSLYRMDKNENIELVMGDATEMFPESLSGLESGFGGLRENQYIWQMTEYDGKLYIGTFDESSLLHPIGQFVNGDLEDFDVDTWKSQVEYIKNLIDIMNPEVPEVPELPEIQPTALVAEDDEDSEEAEGEEADDEAIDEVAFSEEAMYEELVKISTALGQLANYIKDQDAPSFAESVDEMEAKLAEIKEALEERMEETEEKREFETINTILGVIEAIEGLLETEDVQNVRAFAQVCDVLENAQVGFDLYVSEDGINFTAITQDGMGDPYNHGLRVFATTRDYLVFGTANPFYGTQLWKMGEYTSLEEPVIVPVVPTVTGDDDKKPAEGKGPEKTVEPVEPVRGGNGGQEPGTLQDNNGDQKPDTVPDTKKDDKKDDKNDGKQSTDIANEEVPLASESDAMPAFPLWGYGIIFGILALIAVGGYVTYRYKTKKAKTE